MHAHGEATAAAAAAFAILLDFFSAFVAARMSYYYELNTLHNAMNNT